MKIRKYRCPVEGCPKSVKGYSRKNDLIQHEVAKHGKVSVSNPAPVTNGKTKMGAKAKAAVAAAQAKVKEEMD